MFAIRANELEIQTWIEYVNTLSNLADGGSRVGAACECAKANGITLRDVECPRLPSDFPFEFKDLNSFWNL